jgi:plastocyanin
MVIGAVLIAFHLAGGVAPVGVSAASPSSTLPSGAPSPPPSNWPSREMPLPIAVRSPQDLAFKSEVERQYLIFNLMASGRVAYEAGDFTRAAHEWESLLKVPGLPSEIARVVSPLLAESQRQRGSAGAGSADLAPPSPIPELVTGHPSTAARAEPLGVTVAGAVTGGGAIGPGGAVLWLKRIDGPTPAPRPSRKPRVLNQLGKTFVPHVLAIPVGETVVFRNDDPYFHNVFSLTPGQTFDAGLYDSGRSYAKTFTQPGVVELLCNIHASMSAYLYVVDSAYFAQPRPSGAFAIRNVIPGRYELYVWHESAAAISKQNLKVGPTGTTGLTVRIPVDRSPLVIVPDKYGKPRQAQLGY